MEHLISSTSQVKETNTRIIKEALLEMGSGTKIMTASRTGLSVATCNSILNELESAGEILVVPDDNKTNSAGRPSKTYRINELFQVGCCLYATNENNRFSLSYNIIDLSGHVIASKSLSQTIIDYETMKECLLNLKEEFPTLSSVCIGLPGIITSDGVIESCDIIELEGLSLAALVKKDLQLSCRVENDMNLIALGLYHEKKYIENRCVVAISFFENICSGAGIIINGSVHHGKSNFAGEVSFLPFEKDHGRRIRLPLARSENSDIVARTICAFVTILNPDVIMLTGQSISINMMGPISESCMSMLPQKHMPELTYVQNTDHYYLQGLSSMIKSTLLS